MLSIAKINAACNQSACGGKGYLHYLGEPARRQRTDFDDYARGEPDAGPDADEEFSLTLDDLFE